MITYQQQQQQFIQFLNNLPTISRTILGGQWYKIVPYKVSKKCKWRESKNEIKSINKWSIFFSFQTGRWKEKEGRRT